EVDLRPAHAADFLPTTAGEDQQPNDPAELRSVVASLPDAGQLVVAQDALARPHLGRSVGVDDRIAVGVPHGHCPRVKSTQRSPRLARRASAALALDGRYVLRNIAAPDGIDPRRMQALEIRAAQVARDFGERGGPQSRLFGSEVVVDQSAHGVPVLVALLAALSRRVLTERDLGQDLLRRCSRRLDPEHPGLAQGDLASAAMLLPLDNPRLHCAVAVTATTKPKA